MPIEEWLDGVNDFQEVDTDWITKTPVTFYVPVQDLTCPPAENHQIFDEIMSEKVWHEEEHGDHSFFTDVQGDYLLSKIVASIETGNPDDF